MTNINHAHNLDEFGTHLAAHEPLVLVGTTVDGAHLTVTGVVTEVCLSSSPELNVAPIVVHLGDSLQVGFLTVQAYALGTEPGAAGRDDDEDDVPEADQPPPGMFPTDPGPTPPTTFTSYRPLTGQAPRTGANGDPHGWLAPGIRPGAKRPPQPPRGPVGFTR